MNRRQNTRKAEASMDTNVLLLATGCLYLMAMAWTIATPLFDDSTNAQLSVWPLATATLLGIAGYLMSTALR